MQPLLDYFEEQADCIALQVAETEIEVSLLGSFRTEVHDATVENIVSSFRRYQRAGKGRLEPGALGHEPA